MSCTACPSRCASAVRFWARASRRALCTAVRTP